LKTSHELVLGVLQITWEFLNLRVQNAAQEIRQNRGILNRVRLSWARGVLALQTMAGILSNIFDVSFYAFTHNCSLFTLLSRLLLFSEYVAGTILTSLYQFYHKFMMKLKKI
jgi:hypothetical protein